MSFLKLVPLAIVLLIANVALAQQSTTIGDALVAKLKTPPIDGFATSLFHRMGSWSRLVTVLLTKAE